MTQDIISFESKIELKKNELGSKFTNLMYLSKYTTVPKAVCIKHTFFNSLIKEYFDSNSKIFDYFTDLESTAGCYLLDLYSKIKEIINGFEFDREKIKNLISPYANEDTFYAVRSSATHEDSGEHSFAGVYNTDLDIKGLDGIVDSIISSIDEYYSYSAIVARIRTQNYSPWIGLNLIIQEMVYGEISGVSFSTSKIAQNKVIVEWVQGCGEKLVSGEEEASMYIEGEEPNSSYKEILLEVIKLVKRIKNILGYEVDVEWTYGNGKVYLLQARPITDIDNNHNKNAEVFEFDRLYFDSNLAFEKKLGTCNRVYETYTSKRGPFYMLAEENGISTGKGYVIRFNIKGLEKNKELLESLFNTRLSDKVVIDIDDAIRQHIIKKDTLYEYLINMFSSNKNATQTIIIREFIKGIGGCISRLVSGGVLLEYSEDGLLNINRGLANCHEIFLGENTEPVTFLSENILNDIKRFTQITSIEYGSNMIEWSICDDKAFFIDFSAEIHAGFENLSQENLKNRTIVPGNFSGEFVEIKNIEALERLSVSPGVSVNEINQSLMDNPDCKNIIHELVGLKNKPIIIVDKPYAILSLLFDYAEGFIFKQGSFLCHLSIMLREYKVPSIICPEISKLADGKSKLIVNEGKVIGI